MLVEHLILSHHGSYEFGSPSLPQTREAVALHFIDDMDSKMAGVRATLETAAGKRAADAVDRPQSLAAPRVAALRKISRRPDRILAAIGTTGSSSTRAETSLASRQSGQVPPATTTAVEK